jgi:predicted sulfurtransferase
LGKEVTMSIIILFYKYIQIADPSCYAQWQHTIASNLSLKGRIIIAKEGINGTLGGTVEAINAYKDLMLNHPLFSGTDFKESSVDGDYFPRLSIMIKKEIVNLGIDPAHLTPQEGGKHLTPEQAHQLISSKPDNLVILDARNTYESRIGSFIDAITPPLENFRDFPAYINKNKDLFKDKQVLMYCTGGVRCERASAYINTLGIAQQVYQLSGGIHRYVEKYPQGYFRGKNYVFDGRVAMKVTDDILSSCDSCKQPYDEYSNCSNAECNKHIIVCPSCSTDTATCSSICNDLVAAGKVHIRRTPTKIDYSCYTATTP